MNKGALPTSVPSEECLAVYQQLGPLIQARGQSEFSFRNNFTTLFNKGKSVALSLKLVKASRPTNHQTVRPSETSEECLAVLPVAFDKK